MSCLGAHFDKTRAEPVTEAPPRMAQTSNFRTELKQKKFLDHHVVDDQPDTALRDVFNDAPFTSTIRIRVDKSRKTNGNPAMLTSLGNSVVSSGHHTHGIPGILNTSHTLQVL